MTVFAENAVKIAAIGAIGCDPEAPEIGEWWMEWAGELVTLCAISTIEEIAGRLADNDRQREHLDVKRWIMDAGPKGLTRTMLSKRVNGRFNAKPMDEICASLDQDERVITLIMSKSGPGGGRPVGRYVGRKFLAAEDERQSA